MALYQINDRVRASVFIDDDAPEVNIVGIITNIIFTSSEDEEHYIITDDYTGIEHQVSNSNIIGYAGPRTRRFNFTSQPQFSNDDLVNSMAMANTTIPISEIYSHPSTETIPIINSESIVNMIVGNDYKPTIRSTRLVFFTINIGRVVTPRLIEGEYCFCEEDGTIWVNEFQKPSMKKFYTSRDTVHNIKWMTLEAYDRSEQDVQAITNLALSLKTGSKKKSLRMKYKQMPVVKEEKYYASKEFIA